VRSVLGSFVVVCILSGCAGREGPQAAAPRGNLRALGVTGLADPTVKGARILPENVDEGGVYGTEAGGGVRGLVAGMRVVSAPTGAVYAAPDRLPMVPSQVVALPERFGGGFLFQIGTSIWRADRWLAPAQAIFASSTPIQKIVLGLDRVYVRGPNNTYTAFDPRTGARGDLGAWPASPFVGGFAAMDGWRAVAVTDLRGVVATFDAGATWRPLGIHLDRADVISAGDSLAVGGTDPTRAMVWYEVRPDGQVAKLPAMPRPAAPEKPAPIPLEASARPFGKRPLVAAVEDGWPLSDGTAVVARDGAIARVRIADGALIESAEGAYPLKPSRCHPVPLARAKDPAAFGFVCGEANGKTVLYRYEPQSGRMIEVRQWDKPRAISASGSGALAVKGSCAGGGTEEKGQQSYCLFTRDDQWKEIRVRGEIGGERLVVLADGKVAVISPPHGDLATARLTVLEKGKAYTVPITFPPIPADVARALRLGMWMEGFEERRPGVLGGWVDGGGSVVGLEITLDGKAKHGRYIRDGGMPIVSGRYGLGWTAARRGYETYDGGMTWTDIDVPEPSVAARHIRTRACGPIGCTAGGWIRVGWGNAAAPAPKSDAPAPKTPAYRSPPSLDLECEALAGAPPEPKPPTPPKPGHPAVPTPPPYYPHYGPWGYSPYAFNPTATLPPFYNQAPPALRTDDHGLSFEIHEPIERAMRSGPLLRLYTWGPKTAEWEHQGKWQVRWVWPYGGWSDIKSTIATGAPFANTEAARRWFGYMNNTTWTYAFGDDASHALMLGKRTATNETMVMALEAERAPLEVKRADGEPLPDVEAAVRVGGHWYLATQQMPGDLPASIFWVMDGPFLREIARVPRGAFDARPLARLARRADGRAIGLVIDGQASPDRAVATRWVLPIDLDSHAIAEPEMIGAADWSDRAVPTCTGDGNGWIADVPFSGGTRIKVAGTNAGSMYSVLARVRFTRDASCVMGLAGQLDVYGGRAEMFTRKGNAQLAEAPTIPVGIFSARQRYPLRCFKR
jgi:hypothetical protein